MSEIITYVKVTNPPPPIPCTDLPTSKRIIVGATEARMVPRLKRNNAERSTDLRPMMWENCAHVGWKTVEQRRKEVPHQKAWMAVVPVRDVAMAWILFSTGRCKSGEKGEMD